MKDKGQSTKSFSHFIDLRRELIYNDKGSFSLHRIKVPACVEMTQEVKGSVPDEYSSA